MTRKSSRDHCDDPTKELHIEIPCRLAERIENYARQSGSDMSQVVIEALDDFLRTRIRKG